MRTRINKKEGTNKKLGGKRWLTFLVLTIFFLNIGYAASVASVEIAGNASGVVFGDLYIDSVTVTDSNGVNNMTIPAHAGTTLTTNVAFPQNDYAYITYEVVIANGSNSIQEYTGTTFNVPSSTSNIINYDVSGLNAGEYLFPGDEKTVTLTYEYRTTSTTGDYNLIMDFLFNDAGNFYAISNTTTADLVNNARAQVDIVVMNNNAHAVSYRLNINNTRFKLVDVNGNDITNLSIAANTSLDLAVYLVKKPGAIFYKRNYTTGFSLSYDSTTINFGNINITTTPTPGYEDLLVPQIGPVSVDINNTVGTFDVTWSNADAQTESPVTNYVVRIYNQSGTLITTGETGNGDTTYRFINQAPGTYYAIVYGIDEVGNTGVNDCASATTSTTNCRRSNDTEIRWQRTVTFNLPSQVTTNGPYTVNLGETYTTTFTLRNLYSFRSITATMNGVTLTNGTDYTADTDSGVLTIPNVNGDISITVTAGLGSCLAEGTKILMANGTYKNVEKIRYDDLILVYSHETGEFVPEYPIWIENENISSSYQITTFDDGSVLRTVGEHSVFDVDKKLFVDVTNKDEFDVGSRSYSVINNNGEYKLKVVTAIDIKRVKEPIKYYDVVTTRYYNAVADNILTSDGRPALSNFYGFNSDATWIKENRQYALDNNLIASYEEMSYLPYYMYKGLRAGDSTLLYYRNLMSKEDFEKVVIGMLMSQEMKMKPISNGNNRLWMVTTSDDIVINKKHFLVEEGSYYTLKEPLKKFGKTFIGWYNTAENEYYNVGDKVQIYTGTHFISKWK